VIRVRRGYNFGNTPQFNDKPGEKKL